MVKRTPFSVLALVVSVACQLGAIAEFFSQYPTLPVPSSWLREFCVLVGLSVVLTTALFFARRGYVVIILLYSKLLVATVASIPEPKFGGIEMTLFTGLVLEGSAYPHRGRNFWIVASIVALALASLAPLRVWNAYTAEPSLDVVIAYLAVLLAVAAVSLSGRGLSDALAEERRRNGALNDSIMQLTSANIGFQHYASTIGERSTEEERRRVSREIHDTIGYTLTNIKMMIEVSLDSLRANELRRLEEVLETMKEQTLSGLAEARRSLRTLRSVETTRVGGIHLFRRLTDAFANATGVTVDLNFGNAQLTYGDDVDQVVYRMLQEGMTNAFRHGGATRITVNFWQGDGALNVTIRDNGTGAEQIDEGIGLGGMGERIAKLNGTLRAQNVADGFQLLARIPFGTGREAAPWS